MIIRRDRSLKRLLKKLVIQVAGWAVWPGGVRVKMLRTAGITIGPGTFVGNDVSFDTLHPELISIGAKCTITSGTKILTHFYNPSTRKYYGGEVTIGDGTFVGMNTLIVKPVRIGSNSVIGAGSVVTKDIPDSEIWGGNPARFIKERVLTV